MNAPRTAFLTLSFTVAALVFAPLTDVAAQDRLSAGDKVRAGTAGGLFVGYWIGLEDNQLTLRAEDRDTSLVLPLASLRTLEVFEQKTKAGAGAGIGAVLGLIVGGHLGYNLTEEGSGFLDFRRESAAVGGALIGVFAGLTVGAVIGSRIREDSWEKVSLEYLRVSFIPITPHGPGATVRVRWSP